MSSRKFLGLNFGGMGLGVVVQRWVVALAAIGMAASLVGCGPIGPFSGGRLSGEAGSWPIDWDSTAELAQIQLETAPEDPHSVNVWVVTHGGEAFIATSLLVGTEVPEEREWVRNVSDNPDARVRIGDIVYPVRLEAIDDSDLIAAVFSAFQIKYPELKESRAAGARFFKIVPRP